MKKKIALFAGLAIPADRFYILKGKSYFDGFTGYRMQSFLVEKISETITEYYTIGGYY